MCNCIQILWSTPSSSGSVDNITSTEFVNGKPSFYPTFYGVIYHIYWEDGIWYIVDEDTGQIQYTFTSDADCPFSILSDWLPMVGRTLNLNNFQISDPASCNCGCGVRMNIVYKSELNSFNLNAYGTYNTRSHFYFGWFGSQPWEVRWSGVRWELFDGYGHLIAFLTSSDACPRGIFTIQTSDPFTSVDAEIIPCPEPTICDCGIEMRITFKLEGFIVTLEVSGEINGQLYFQGFLNGQPVSLFFDGGNTWNFGFGDPNIPNEFQTISYLTQPYSIGCPISDQWNNKSEYQIDFTTGIACVGRCGFEDRTFKEFKSVKLPEQFNEQQRGDISCCCEYMVLAGNGTESWKNDVTSAWIKLSDANDSVQFVLEKDGQPISFIPTPMSFVNEPNAWFTTINWIDVLNSDGEGCYTLSIVYDISGISGVLVWGMYKLKQYTIENALKTARIRVKFNGKQQIDGIDFTASNVESSMRFFGFIGKRQPNTEIDNIIYSDRQMKRVIRENLNQYEITTDPSGECIIKPLVDLFLLSENEMWISDYNAHNHSYRYLDTPVIVEESSKIDYKDFSRLAVLTCIVSDKFKNQRTFY